jgi:CRISPR-associated protein Csm3
MEYTKIELTANIALLSGLHIGASSAYSAIGATDSPVLRDALTNRPLIPGSSLKGKMRTLLAASINESVAKTANGDHDKIKRLFGASIPKIVHSRLIFSDLVMTDQEMQRLKNLGAREVTEVKFENTIDRLTAKANPRQIERIIAGACFDFRLVYERGQKQNNPDSAVEYIDDAEVLEDFQTIALGLRLLEKDYLGGSGTRGYGKIAFDNALVKVMIGSLNPELLTQINQEFADFSVTDNELSDI